MYKSENGDGLQSINEEIKSWDRQYSIYDENNASDQVDVDGRQGLIHKDNIDVNDNNETI